MTNLSDKFADLQTQLATQHAALITALSTINTSITDMSTAIQGKIDTTNLQLEGVNGTLSSLADLLDQINVNTDTIINNGSLNAQRLISAIAATSCICDPNVPLLPPPTDTTPISLEDEAKCKRIQYFYDLYTTWIAHISQYITNTAAIVGGVPTSLLASIISDQSITDGELHNGLPSSVDSPIVTNTMFYVYNNGSAYAAARLLDLLDPAITQQVIEALFAVDNA